MNVKIKISHSSIEEKIIKKSSHNMLSTLYAKKKKKIGKERSRKMDIKRRKVDLVY